MIEQGINEAGRKPNLLCGLLEQLLQGKGLSHTIVVMLGKMAQRGSCYRRGLNNRYVGRGRLMDDEIRFRRVGSRTRDETRVDLSLV